MKFLEAGSVGLYATDLVGKLVRHYIGEDLNRHFLNVDPIIPENMNPEQQRIHRLWEHVTGYTAVSMLGMVDDGLTPIDILSQ